MDFRGVFVYVCMFFLLASLIAVIVLLTIKMDNPESKKMMSQAAAWLSLISGVLWTSMIYAVFLQRIGDASAFLLIQNGIMFFIVIYTITAGILELRSNNKRKRCTD